MEWSSWEEVEDVVRKQISNLDVATVSVALVLVYLFKSLIYKGWLTPEDISFRGFENVGGAGQDRQSVINEVRKRKKGRTYLPHYPNGWFAILPSEELGKKGVKDATFCGKEAVLWRGENGTAYVADAYCPHLGAHLGVDGEVHGNCIQCPFHHWSFDGAKGGKLDCIPYSQRVLENVGLKMWTSLEINGFIWVWHHEDATQLPTWFPELEPVIRDGYGLATFHMDFCSHIQDIVENVTDLNHFMPIHGNTVVADKSLSFYDRVKSLSVVELDQFGLEWCPEHDDPKKPHILSMKLLSRVKFFGLVFLYNSDTLVRQVGPGICLTLQDTLFGKVLMVETNTPISKFHVRMSQKIYFSNRLIHWTGERYKNSVIQQIWRDAHIWNRKIQVAAAPLPKEDKKMQTFRRWYAQFYSKKSA